MSGTPARRWTVTTFEQKTWQSLVDEEGVWPDVIRYFVFQIEECPETKRHHLQGYLELLKPQRFSWIKKWLDDDTVHCAIARGTSDQNYEYCTKDETRVAGPWEYGERSRGQGSRSDLQAVQDAIDSGQNELEVAEQHFGTWCKYYKALARYRQLQAAAKAREFRRIDVTVFYGVAGAGKTRTAFDEAGPLCYWIPAPVDSKSPLWFDGYEGQDAAILDDFDGESISFSFFMRLLDGYPLQLPVKGGFVQSAITRLWITSNIPVERWFPRVAQDDDRRGALRRRIGRAVHFPGPLVP